MSVLTIGKAECTSFITNLGMAVDHNSFVTRRICAILRQMCMNVGRETVKPENNLEIVWSIFQIEDERMLVEIMCKLKK